MNRNLFFAILILIASLSISAQEKATGTPAKDCNYKYADPKELAYRKSGSEGLGGVYFYLKDFVVRCPDSPFIETAREQFHIAEDEWVNHNMAVAKYYLTQAENGKSTVKGAILRLKKTVEQFPGYSKLDETLYLLVKASLMNKNFDLADESYRRLLKDYYLSPYICTALSLIKDAKEKGENQPQAKPPSLIL